MISSLSSLYVETIPSTSKCSVSQEESVSPVVSKSVGEVLVRGNSWADRQFGHGTRGVGTCCRNQEMNATHIVNCLLSEEGAAG